MRFTPLLEEEERTGDESWRNELDEDEEGALFVLENGGGGGEYYYNNDGSLVDEDQFYENMRGAADSRGVDWYWRDMDNTWYRLGSTSSW